LILVVTSQLIVTQGMLAIKDNANGGNIYSHSFRRREKTSMFRGGGEVLCSVKGYQYRWGKQNIENSKNPYCSVKEFNTIK
jgi:hypothetical protein